MTVIFRINDKVQGGLHMEIKVRFSETDLLGHINNVSYFTYLEAARIDFIEEVGLKINTEEHFFILASASCDFIQQGYFGQTLKINTSVSRIGTKSLVLTSEMFEKESGELIAKGESALVYFNRKEQKSVNLPEKIKEKLQLYTLELS